MCTSSSNLTGSWIKFETGEMIQFGNLPDLVGKQDDYIGNLPISFKDNKYTIVAGMWCTSGTVFHIAAETEKTYKLEYTDHGQIIERIYSASSFIVIGKWK